MHEAVHQDDATKTPCGLQMPPAGIGTQLIGAAGRTFIIAEAGVNHNGDINKALQLVDAAADVGADAVKFQVFQARDLVTADARTAAYQRERTGDQSQQAMLSRLELDDTALRLLKNRAVARGITFLATPFSVNDLSRLVVLDVAAIKIASTDLTNTGLLAAAVSADKPMIVSTGAATEMEIRLAVEWFRACGAASRLLLLHCVSAYPTPVEAANLAAMRTLSDVSGVPVGFSDHTASTQIGAWAVCAGASILEKHLTLNRGLPGPDHAMSLDPPLFAEYVREVRVAEAALGRGTLGMQSIEKEVRDVARRSVVAARSIARGTVVSADMLTLKRPGNGIGPERMSDLVGRVACTDIPSDTLLAWNMVQ